MNNVAEFLWNGLILIKTILIIYCVPMSWKKNINFSAYLVTLLHLFCSATWIYHDNLCFTIIIIFLHKIKIKV